MPDKRRPKRNDGKTCSRCWVNKLKHGCPQAQAWLRKHPEFDTHYESYDYDEMKAFIATRRPDDPPLRRRGAKLTAVGVPRAPSPGPKER